MALGIAQKKFGIGGFTHSAGGHCAYASRLEAAQLFAKAGERLPASVQRQFVQGAIVQTFGQANRLAQGFHFFDNPLAVPFDRLADHHAKRIGPQVNRRKQGGIAFHRVFLAGSSGNAQKRLR
ncbi:hypothetical protein D3C76_1346750 [compost metagenome]